jgi:hypothetical protein
MAIGIRRDRGGVMPATEVYPALAATGIVKGDLCKLSSGKLVICDDGDAGSEDQLFLAVASYVSGVTAPAASTYDQLVIPVDDQLTFVGPVAEGTTPVGVDTVVPGSTLGINATGDGFADAAAASDDFVIIKVLEYDATAGTATVEGRFLMDTDTHAT